MRHQLSDSDRAFMHAFRTCAFPAADFHHREHVRLAYALLVEHDAPTATAEMRTALLAFLQHNGVDPAKYHATMTQAWMMAVAYFMERSAPCASFDDFIAASPALLDPQIMFTHYSRELLLSPDARAGFVAPDLQSIPP